jgi:hypothetical protein
MLRSFLLELRHLSLDYPGVDPVAPHLIVNGCNRATANDYAIFLAFFALVPF